MARISIDVETWQSRDSSNGPAAYYCGIHIPDVSCGYVASGRSYKSEKAARDECKLDALRMLAEHNLAAKHSQRRVVATHEGTILLVEWRYGAWGYTFAGPDRRMGGGTANVGGTFAETVDYARKHAMDCYGGVAWESGDHA